jgi:hypothetical protein
MKTNELSGAALDWAVAKCEPDDKLAIYFDETTGEPLCHDDWPDNQEFRPSTNWAQGGAIIEREKISLLWMQFSNEQFWVGSIDKDEHEHEMFEGIDIPYEYEATGTTPLTAAMRCYVASKMGDEVDVPKELT